jgi:lactaldehyde dehydrogenase/glycolaldehyde dehydrogenase
MAQQWFEAFGIKRGQVFIGGKWVDSAGSGRHEILSPTDESLVDVVAHGHLDDAERAISAARQAFPAWAATSAIARGALLSKFADIVDQHASTLAELLVSEQGKPLSEARIEMSFASALLRHAAESARRLEGEILPGDARHEQIWIQRVPFGVVAAMTAWNFPAALFARKVGPALVTGNTIVLKPHELTPLNTLYLAELARQAGFPDGVLNVITGEGREVGAHMVTHRGTDLVSLTGSVRAGGEIYAAAAPQIKPLRLELGGKAPFIVMEDADVDKAVDAAIVSKFFAGGAVCTSNDRMYLHEHIHDQFLEKFLSRVNTLSVGNPMQDVSMGPRISAMEVSKLEKIAALAVEQGAKTLDVSRPSSSLFDKGHWFFPTVFSVGSNDLSIMKEETFGPMIAAMKVSSFDQAMNYANDSEYGLSAFLFTNDNRRIMRAVNDLQFGEVYVNRGSGESVHGFHTGYKKSGLGGEDGKHGIEGFLRKKTVYNRYD